MKIGIITYHCAHNYGAVLQTFALQEQLKSLGHDVEVIDYRPDYLVRHYRILPTWKGQNLVYFLKSLILLFLKFAQKIRRHFVFERFISSRLAIGESVIREPLKSHYDCDVYIVGSDQIWNPAPNGKFDPMYFAAFEAKAGVKRVAYAASRASCSLSFSEEAFFIENLPKFDYISVRESELARTFSRLTNMNIENVLDPTLLVDGSVWDSFHWKLKNPSKYIMCFMFAKNEAVLDKAYKYAREIGAVVIQVNGRNFLPDPNNLLSVSPEQFIGIIRHSCFILTDSFHGMALSIALKRPFYVFKSNCSKDERKKSLLQQIGLLDRLVDNAKLLEFREINYDTVFERLLVLRKRSLNFLEKALSDSL